MLINFSDLLLFPELILLFGSIIILLIGLYNKENTFSVVSNLSVLLLILVGILIFFDKGTSFLNFNKFFILNSFVKYFKILVVIGSLATIIISNEYFKDQKLIFFEIPILILL